MKTNERLAAIISGITLIIMAVAAGVAYGAVYTKLVVPADPQTTFQNILSQRGLFSLGLLGWLVTIIADIIVSWSFYQYLKPVHGPLAQLGAWFRLSYVAFLGFAVANLVVVQQLAYRYQDQVAASASESIAQVARLLMFFEYLWSFGLIIFGCHLVLVGVVAFKSIHIPKLLSALLLVAGASYMLIHGLGTFAPELATTTKVLSGVLALPMTIGELGFGIWLLIKGGKIKQ